jgi:valyl-tRNA synthetase
VYEYFWNDFCDWYVEATKLSLRADDDSSQAAGEKDRATTVLLDVLAESLRLLHPLLPLVTEEIYGKLPNTQGLLITAPYPEYAANRADPKAEADFGFIQELVRMVRTLRSECTITPDKKVRVLVRLNDDPAREAGLQEAGLKEACLDRDAGSPRKVCLQDNAPLVRLLAGIGDLEIQAAVGAAVGKRPAGSIGLVGSGFEAFVYVAEAADLPALKKKFIRDVEKDAQFIRGLQSKLANERFVKNAPPELVAGEKAKLADAVKRMDKLESYIRDMA